MVASHLGIEKVVSRFKAQPIQLLSLVLEFESHLLSIFQNSIPMLFSSMLDAAEIATAS